MPGLHTVQAVHRTKTCLYRKTHGSLVTGNITAEDVVPTERITEFYLLISALVTWLSYCPPAAQSHHSGGRTSSLLQTRSSQSTGATGSGIASATRTTNLGPSFPRLSHTNLPDLVTQGPARGRASTPSASTECFWSRPLWMKHSPSPFSATEPAG